MRSERTAITFSRILRFLRGTLQQFFSGSLVEGNGMQFIPSHVPPARQNGAGQKAGNNLSPDQRLNVLGRDEILLHLGEDVRKISERSYKISTAARRRTFSEKLGRLPESLSMPPTVSAEKS